MENKNLTNTDESHPTKRVRKLIETILRINLPESVSDDTSLFGSEVGLDSIDALELVVGLEKEFNVKIAERKDAKNVITSITTIINFLRENKKI